MFGAVPGIFRTKESAQKAAEAYQIEEEEDWCVVLKKICLVGGNGCEHIDKSCHMCDKKSLEPKMYIGYYRPCRVSDIWQADKEGFTRIS